MTPEQYIHLFMQPKPKKRSFPDQSQYDYEMEPMDPGWKPSIVKRTVRYILGLVR
ncbi:MAG: hypothetical protein H6Q99_2009 [Proteobacteria bacterium]|nr:hypothetical protein [Pseudomonadota bacterium]